ncbi:MAG: hypothetical protein LH609_18215, partial [Rudanella sp.]|nr:hypothetical protein [Rudanella sp.]
MKQLSLFLLVSLALSSCQINVMQPANTNTDAIVPDANARIARKLSVGIDGKTVYGEERYDYNAKGQLTKLSRLNRNPNGQMELISYNEFVYVDSDRLSQKLTFTRIEKGIFVQHWVTTYDYPAANLIRETGYAMNAATKAMTPQSRWETTMEQGRKARVISYYMNNKVFEKSRETVYRYEYNRLVAEESLNSNNTMGNSLRYTYKGRTAKAEEFMGNRPESISEQAFQYDAKGRLI